MCQQNLLRMSSKDVYSASFPVAASLLQVLYQAVAPRYDTKLLNPSAPDISTVLLAFEEDHPSAH
ncbi:hypothetical protein CK203_050463 [Vitis vinifera]|uniref:Uncharacterized protein n=1 Tax=Vitis vinifera TaxID=29760 RepID=A0A438H2G1_VITVI|nr:hypothetical protein CK203_050463 [Vitis vinifera]